MQSVIADSAYLVSGTLTNYALPEWFAHGFKTRPEFHFLEEKISPQAHKTKTAAMFNCEDVLLDSQYMTLIGVKYLLCNRPHPKIGRTQTVLATSGETHKPSPLITPDQPLIQHFNLPGEIAFDNLTLQLATYRQANAYADVTVRVYSGDVLQGESTVQASEIHDNQWVNFHYSDIVRLAAKNNRLEVHAKPTSDKGKLSAWTYPMPKGSVMIESSGKTQYAAVAAKFRKEIPIPEHLAVQQIEDNLELWENTQVTGSGYTLTRLDPSLPANYQDLELLNASHTSYQLRYSGKQPAWLILPVRLYPQWQAYINDRPTTIEGFMDILPAIQVAPGDKVTYRYEPHTLYWLFLLSVTGLAITLFFLIRWRKT
jgi:hypothetical protein